MTTYKVKKSKIYSIALFLVFPGLFTLITLLEGEPASRNEWIGICGFWLVGFILILAPLLTKLEIGKDYIKNYFFGFCANTISREDIVTIGYGNLLRGGLGYGKGLNIRVRKGLSKNYSISEKMFGKEAIIHAYSILSSGKILEIDENKNKLIAKAELKGSIGIAVSILVFFISLGIPDTYPTFLKFISPLSILSIIGWMTYIILKSEK